jgi:hypothetical protein
MARSTIYRQNLAWIHHAAFSDFARRAGRELLQSLRLGGNRLPCHYLFRSIYGAPASAYG